MEHICVLFPVPIHLVNVGGNVEMRSERSEDIFSSSRHYWPSKKSVFLSKQRPQDTYGIISHRYIDTERIVKFVEDNSAALVQGKVSTSESPEGGFSVVFPKVNVDPTTQVYVIAVAYPTYLSGGAQVEFQAYTAGISPRGLLLYV